MSHLNKNVLQMYVIMIDFVHIKSNLTLNINFLVFSCRKEKKQIVTHSTHKIGRQGRKGLILKFVSNC